MLKFATIIQLLYSMGGFESLGPHQVNTLTKHKIEKQSSLYGPVAEQKTLQIMAGFKNGEPYHLDKAKSFSHTVLQCLNKCC